MKYTLLIIITLVAAMLACSPPQVTANGSPAMIPNITLILHNYPSHLTANYIVDTNSIKVALVDSSIRLDSVLFIHTFSYNEYQNYLQLVKQFDKDHYENKCVQDGQVFTLIVAAKDSILRKVRFSNYYLAELEKIAAIINTHVDSANRIVYNKDMISKNCK
jgi:hypothetical protein